MAKKEKKDKKSKGIIKELYNTEKGRSLLFFGFYIVFFVAIAILMRSMHEVASTNNNKELKTEVTYRYHLEKMKEENYHYKYLSTLGDSISLFEGDRNASKELFTMTTNGMISKYFRDGELFITEKEGSWIACDSPYLLEKFYEVDTIEDILDQATFISKTEYERGGSSLAFKISNKKLIKIIEKKETLEEEQNEIIVILDKNKNIEKIEYNLTAYGTYLAKVITPVKIEITYSNFGEIKEIEKP